MTLLSVHNLRTYFATQAGIARAVDDVSFDVAKGETLAIVGESGCGKTVLANSVMRIFRHGNVQHPSGEILLNDKNLLELDSFEMQAIRGHQMAMIFQEPMAALNPVWSIKDQIAEPLINHLKFTKPKAYQRALELLESLGVPSPDRVLNTYPHTLSGGMRQRVAIAIALACKPSLLIADEPTTALDVTVQAQILQLIKDMQKELGMGVIIITHDLGVVNEIADRVMVMYSGRAVESGTTKSVLFSPKHPYTMKLIAAVPRLDKLNSRNEHLEAIEGQVRPATSFVEGCRFAERCMHASDICRTEQAPQMYSANEGNPHSDPIAKDHRVACYIYDEKSGVVLKESPKKAAFQNDVKAQNEQNTILEIAGLKTWFPLQSGFLRRHTADIKAVDDISISVKSGETIAVVGESGCGKSTLGQTLLRLVDSTSGTAVLNSGSPTDILTADRTSLMGIRRQIQIIFQDPFASLNPRFSVREIIEEGLKIHFPNKTADERDQEIGDILEEVGLPRETRFRYPHEFSGGQRQRVAIARALILKPKILVLDEATSALDVSIQAQVLNLLKSLQSKHSMTFIFITHNLGVVRQIADRIAVMYLGKIVEIGDVESVMESPKHPYTEKLIGSIPRLVPDIKLPEPLKGDVPSPVFPPKGCAFHPRCPKLQKASDKVRRETMGDCSTVPPNLNSENAAETAHQFRCHHPN